MIAASRFAGFLSLTNPRPLASLLVRSTWMSSFHPERLPLRLSRSPLFYSPFVRTLCTTCLRKLHTPSLVAPTKFRTQERQFLLRQTLRRPQQRLFATIVHNQKYSEDNLPLTLEITPACVKVVSLKETRSDCHSNSSKFRNGRIIPT
jgi:hypothetical protein